jgi:hypothetical protein
LKVRALLAGHELYVVHQKHVNRAIFLTKSLRLVVAYGVNQLVHEALGRYVGEAQVAVALLYGVADRVHEVRLA